MNWRRERIMCLGALLPLAGACSESNHEATRPASTETSSSGETVESVDAHTTAGLDSCAKWLEDSSAVSRFVPPDVPNVSLDTLGEGSLALFSSTLISGPNGLELYAGVCNDSQFTLCSVALQVELYDHTDALIGAASGAVQSGRIYSFSQSPNPIACVAPGQTAMAALTSLPTGTTLADVKSVGHRFPAFVIDDAVELPSVSVNQVEAFETPVGIAFRGLVTNDSDSPVRDIEVSVFPITEIGRPLGNGRSSGSVEIPPKGTWAFETSTVIEAGANQVAFAAASFVVAP